jgi:hypothetical protein
MLPDYINKQKNNRSLYETSWKTQNILFTHDCELIIRRRMQLAKSSVHCTAVVVVSEMLTRLISTLTFSLSCYTFFLTLTHLLSLPAFVPSW